MNQILNNKIEEENSAPDKSILKIVLLSLVICAIVCVSTIFALKNKGNENIISNVYISGVNVSDKSKEDARELVESYLNTFKDKDVSLNYGENSYKVTSSELGFSVLTLDSAIDEAYGYGRSGSFFENNFEILFSSFKNKEINLEYTLDDDAYNAVLNNIASANEALALDDVYEIGEGEIRIIKGQNGLKIDANTLKEYIVAAIQNNVESVEIPVIDSECNKIDFGKLYEEVYVAPKNASYISGENFEVIVEENGKNFDVQKAKEEYSKLKSGESMIIALEIVEPKVKVADLNAELFKDVLATYSTTYNVSEKNRVKNLTTASSRCNGTIIYPGKEFSFHKTIGSRTIANGYASAHSFAGGKVVDSIGGGICQISSTLYNIVLMADLNVTERTAHGMYVSYVKPSLDATISEGVYDFKFVNNRSYPIMIESSVENGIVTMSIKGIKEASDKNIELLSVIQEEIDYVTIEEKDASMYVGTMKVVQEPAKGYISESYKIIKDTDGNEISRTLISKDKYAATNKIVKVGTKVIVEEPIKPIEEVTEVTEPERDLPQGWDSPESPYSN